MCNILYSIINTGGGASWHVYLLSPPLGVEVDADIDQNLL